MPPLTKPKRLSGSPQASASGPVFPYHYPIVRVDEGDLAVKVHALSASQGSDDRQGKYRRVRPLSGPTVTAATLALQHENVKTSGCQYV
jgi:hypothetical protein